MTDTQRKGGAVFDYIAHGDPNDELARAKAEAEYTLGVLGSVLEERNALIAERDALLKMLADAHAALRARESSHG